jgi:hypothetical protein
MTGERSSFNSDFSGDGFNNAVSYVLLPGLSSFLQELK